MQEFEETDEYKDYEITTNYIDNVSDIAVSNEDINDEEQLIAEGDNMGNVLVWRTDDLIESNTPFAVLKYEGQVFDV